MTTDDDTLAWGSCRISTPSGEFYLCSTEDEADRLRADSLARGKPRAIFSREELGGQMEKLEAIPKDERLDWLRTVIALKTQLPEAKIEKIQRAKREASSQERGRRREATRPSGPATVTGSIPPGDQDVLVL